MLQTLLDWAPTVGGTGLLTWAVLAIVAPQALKVGGGYLEALTPLVKQTGEGVAAVTTALWDGFKDMADNANSLLFVAAVAGVAFIYAGSISTCTGTSKSCTECVDNLRADYKFVPRTPAEKKEYLRSNPEHATKPWYTTWFNL